MTPTDIANEIIAEAMLRLGKDMVSNVYTVTREVTAVLTEYMVKKREEERERAIAKLIREA